MKQIEILKDGELIKVWAHKSNKGLWLHCDGQIFFQENESKKSRKSGGVGSASKDSVTAPMPGKVMKVNVEAGDKVTQGDVLVVMEAMKMEYSLKAEMSGTVDVLSCAVDDQVDVGQSLVKIKED